MVLWEIKQGKENHVNLIYFDANIKTKTAYPHPISCFDVVRLIPLRKDGENKTYKGEVCFFSILQLYFERD